MRARPSVRECVLAAAVVVVLFASVCCRSHRRKPSPGSSTGPALFRASLSAAGACWCVSQAVISNLPLAPSLPPLLCPLRAESGVSGEASVSEEGRKERTKEQGKKKKEKAKRKKGARHARTERAPKEQRRGNGWEATRRKEGRLRLDLGSAADTSRRQETTRQALARR